MRAGAGRTYLFARLSSMSVTDTLDFQMGKTSSCASLPCKIRARTGHERAQGEWVSLGSGNRAGSGYLRSVAQLAGLEADDVAAVG